MAPTLRPRPLPPVLLTLMAPLPTLYASLGLSLFALLGMLYLAPTLGPTAIHADLNGRDFLKTYKDPIKSGARLRIDLHPLAHPLHPFALSDSFVTQEGRTERARHGIVIQEFPHYQVRPMASSPTQYTHWRIRQLSAYLSSLLSLLMAMPRRTGESGS
ncbi:hypothetical protein CERSUDRAFT_100143 [Gelatoporia subvermispora B]|uniref:Uncharacterized protein n=1 Tax=Ceriporiopsis subvermispora (strain B) TaxID=914234 RepID=M2QHW0_CERS8|nr:hypothetical protein CERSUDRAFT_100143 [Gelatoporia subvermispora B]